MLQPEDCRLSVTDEDFAYLSLQQGAVADLAYDRSTWEKAYAERLYETYQSMVPYLPRRCSRILDIGSGLGGIDVLLNRHYGGKVEIVPVDGKEDRPVMERHALTFNSEKVTRQFLANNGVARISYYAPTALPSPTHFSLVVSIASWCFHYPPGVYLSFVRGCMQNRSRLIVDVRDREDWLSLMAQSFEEIACANVARKSRRMVYGAL